MIKKQIIIWQKIFLFIFHFFLFHHLQLVILALRHWFVGKDVQQFWKKKFKILLMNEKTKAIVFIQ